MPLARAVAGPTAFVLALHPRAEVTIVHALLPASVWAIVDGLERAGRARDQPP